MQSSVNSFLLSLRSPGAVALEAAASELSSLASYLEKAPARGAGENLLLSDEGRAQALSLLRDIASDEALSADSPAEAMIDAGASYLQKTLSQLLSSQGINSAVFPSFRLHFEGGELRLQLPEEFGSLDLTNDGTTELWQEAAGKLYGGVLQLLLSKSSPYFDHSLASALIILQSRSISGFPLGIKSFSSCLGTKGKVLLLQAEASVLKSIVERVRADRGEAQRSIDDAGQYVPGSAKERAALQRKDATRADLSAEEILRAMGREMGEASIRQLASKLIGSCEVNLGAAVPSTVTVHLWPAAQRLLALLQSENAQGCVMSLRHAMSRLVESEADATVIAPALQSLAEAVQTVTATLAEVAPEAAAVREEVLVSLLMGSLDSYQPAIKRQFDETLEKAVGEKLLTLTGGALGKSLELLSTAAAQAAATELQNKVAKEVGSFESRPIDSYRLESVCRSVARVSHHLGEAISSLMANNLPSFYRVDSDSAAWEMARLMNEAKKQAAEMGLAHLVRQLTTRKTVTEFIRRGGKSVEHVTSPEAVLELFGFKFLEFGRSLSDKRRRDLTQRTAASFIDLADATGLSPSEMSIGGALSFALASRGVANSKAHYDGNPSRNIINMNRDNGDGSLAHEWGHALDYRSSGVALSSVLSGDIASAAVQGLPDYVLDAMREVRRAMYTCSREEFIEQRRVELLEVSNRRSEVLEQYDAMLEAIKADSGAKLKDARDKLKQEKIRQIEPPASTSEAQEAQETGKRLEAALAAAEAVYERDKARVEPLRLFANALLARRKDLKGELALAEGGHGVGSGRLPSRRLERLDQAALQDAASKEDGSKVEVYPSKYLMDAITIEMHGGKKDYWQKPTELYARAFETFVAERLHAAGRWNNFLVDEDSLINNDEKLSTYPTGATRERILSAIDTLLQAIKKSGILKKPEQD